MNIQLQALKAHSASLYGAQRLAQPSPRFRSLHIPNGQDLTDVDLTGGAVAAWIEAALPSADRSAGEAIR